jgi:hypothetical protein
MSTIETDIPMIRNIENSVLFLNVFFGLALLFLRHLLYGGPGASFFSRGSLMIVLPALLLIASSIGTMIARGYWRWLFLFSNALILAAEWMTARDYLQPISAPVIWPIFNMTSALVFTLFNSKNINARPGSH